MMSKIFGFRKIIYKVFDNKSNKDETIVSDKSTLIREKMEMRDIVTVNGVAEDYLLQIAATAGKESKHQIAKCIVEKAREKHLEVKKSAGFIERPGLGIEIVIDDNIVLVGNKKFMNENYISLESLEKVGDKVTEKGYILIYIAIDEKLSGIIVIGDN